MEFILGMSIQAVLSVGCLGFSSAQTTLSIVQLSSISVHKMDAAPVLLTLSGRLFL